MKSRRIISLLLALALFLVPCAASAAQGAVLTVSAAEAGGDVLVTITLKGSAPFSSISLVLDYDRARLTCESIQQGGVLEGTMAVVNPKAEKGAALSAISLSPMPGEGTVAVVRFTQAAGADLSAFTLATAKISDASGNRLPLEVVYDLQGSAPADDPAKDGKDPVSTIPPAPYFTDVEGHWGWMFIEKAAVKGIMRADENGAFRPDEPALRWEVVTALYRANGSPQGDFSAPFGDTASLTEEARQAIAWAYSKGFVAGRSSEVFGPDDRVTRQDALTILFAAEGNISGEESAKAAAYDAAYDDSASVASYAKRAVYWGLYHGYITGTGTRTLSPAGNITRAQLATILVNYTE